MAEQSLILTTPLSLYGEGEGLDVHHYKRDRHAHNNYNNDMYMYSQNHFVEVFDEQAPFCLRQSVVLWNI